MEDLLDEKHTELREQNNVVRPSDNDDKAEVVVVDWSHRYLENYGFPWLSGPADGDADNVPQATHAPFNDPVYRARIESQTKLWNAFLSSNALQGRSGTNSGGTERTLKKLCRGGVPPALRPRVWSIISGARALSASDPSLFDDLVNRVNEQDAGAFADSDGSDRVQRASTISEAARDIEKDVDRTFTSHPYFRSSVGKNALRRCLRAWVLHRPSIGYCQSHNYLMGVALIINDGVEESAFWLFVALIDNVLPARFFDGALYGAHLETLVLSHLIDKKITKLGQHLRQHQVDPALFMPWFTTMFVNYFPVETVLRIWDCVLSEGDKILQRVSLGMLKMHEAQLLAVLETGPLLMAMMQLGRDLTDVDRLLSISFGIRNLKRSTIVRWRGKYAPRLEKAHEERRDVLHDSAQPD